MLRLYSDPGEKKSRLFTTQVLSESYRTDLAVAPAPEDCLRPGNDGHMSFVATDHGTQLYAPRAVGSMGSIAVAAAAVTEVVIEH